MMEEIKWYYEEKGERKGPVSEDTIVDLIKKGRISYGSMVWREEFPEWKKIEETELLKYLSKVTPPPLKGEPVNNTVVWILAFAPIIGLILEYIIAYAEYGNDLFGNIAVEYAVRSGKFWYITVFLNIGLCILDERKLKKAGHDTSKFGRWVWLVPVYLYKRAKACGHSLAYFITWLVCFFAILFGLI